MRYLRAGDIIRHPAALSSRPFSDPIEVLNHGDLADHWLGVVTEIPQDRLGECFITWIDPFVADAGECGWHPSAGLRLHCPRLCLGVGEF